jgi:hypothetical protein
VSDTEIRWPAGYAQTYYAKVLRHADKARGKLLCVDPATGATSNPGWALFQDGKLVDSGEVTGLHGETPDRLFQLFWRLHDDGRFNNLNMLVVEQLRGKMVAAQLHWSVGVILAALPAEVVCEIPIAVWKSVAAADPNYAKGDEADARTFGVATLAVAAGDAGTRSTRIATRRKRSRRSPAKRSRRVRHTSNRRRRVK